MNYTSVLNWVSDELLGRRTWFGQFDEQYFSSELSVGWTFRSLNMVRTVWWTVLRFLTDLLMRCKLQPELHCAGCTLTRVHMLTLNTCSLSMCGWKPRQWMPWLVPRAHLFISLYLLGPTDNAEPPTSPQMRPFPLKQEAENIHAISHVLLSHFFPSSIGQLSGFNQSDTRFIELDKQFPENVKQSVLDPEHGFIAGHRTAWTKFAK